MVSHSTGMLHSTTYGLPQCMCVLAVFHSMCVYWSWSPTARVCTGSFSQYVCVLVMSSHSTCVSAGSFHSMCVYWLCPPTAHVCVLAVFTVCVCTGYVLPQHMCAGSFAVRVCTGHGLP